MVLELPPPIEAALRAKAVERGIDPAALALEVLGKQLLPAVEPADEWERRLFAAAVDCGVSVPNEALSSEGLYE